MINLCKGIYRGATLESAFFLNKELTSGHDFTLAALAKVPLLSQVLDDFDSLFKVISLPLKFSHWSVIPFTPLFFSTTYMLTHSHLPLSIKQLAILYFKHEKILCFALGVIPITGLAFKGNYTFPCAVAAGFALTHYGIFKKINAYCINFLGTSAERRYRIHATISYLELAWDFLHNSNLFLKAYFGGVIFLAGLLYSANLFQSFRRADISNLKFSNETLSFLKENQQYISVNAEALNTYPVPMAFPSRVEEEKSLEKLEEFKDAFPWEENEEIFWTNVKYDDDWKASSKKSAHLFIKEGIEIFLRRIRRSMLENEDPEAAPAPFLVAKERGIEECQNLGQEITGKKLEEFLFYLHSVIQEIDGDDGMVRSVLQTIGIECANYCSMVFVKIIADELYPPLISNDLPLRERILMHTYSARVLDMKATFGSVIHSLPKKLVEALNLSSHHTHNLFSSYFAPTAGSSVDTFHSILDILPPLPCASMHPREIYEILSLYPWERISCWFENEDQRIVIINMETCESNGTIFKTEALNFMLLKMGILSITHLPNSEGDSE